MARVLVTLYEDSDRERVAHWAKHVPVGSRVEFHAPKRTIPQNERLWAMLTDVAMQLLWHDKRLSTEDWKILFIEALKRELRVVPNLDGTGFVNLSRSSSDLSKEEMSDLFELIHAFGAQHGVTFRDQESA